MDALKIISLLLSLVKIFVTWAEQKKWMEAGEAEAVKRGLEETNVVIDKARKAREEVRSDLARNPDNVMRDDEFTRKD